MTSPSPRAPRHAFLDWDGPIPFAHRGGASDAPENTMEAFQYAIDLGYRYIETDVQVTSDSVLVAFHDDDLRRTTGRAAKISELPWAEVSKELVDGKAPIPLLEDLLGAFPDVRINIDCKVNRAEAALVAALRRTNALSRVCVAAFSDLRLRRLRKELGDGLCSSLGPAETALLRYGLLRRSTALAAQVPVRQGPLTVVNGTLVRRAHAAGIQVHVWTIDDAAEMNRLLDLGVDGIMTDRPVVLRQVLEARGAWHS
ncbi:MAG TPA: glycerophosphodiester phosphodiesterase [Ilumatobacteraceae bacterium]